MQVLLAGQGDIRVSYCVQNIEPCSSCDRNSCQPPRNCLAGLVKDSCECCYVCARTEGERCDHEDLHLEGFGHCGDNLECRVRNDLDWDDPPEAVCVCSKQKPLCGSDGVTYENICQLTETRYRRRDGLRAVSAEPCVKPPKILSPPLNVRNSTGSYAAMTCEANAWPAPDIQWHLEKNGNLILLPGNNTLLAVQYRSGPGMDEATSWLLFLRLSEEDEGIYTCKAHNDAGDDTASATVSIISN
ncbi:insulin-like growth factor-binding protein-related protein 1 isoform X2 [Uloborus diversus]|uniref:insulin-like growth factor-binding protein-related protein 1 isoform X2 n=1 Tax=Uloborus diversus TaxID=327109 RepID=UPI0024093AFA|nr:insulin-like growth factor-binding protein-related protein 1 isoform X2 [Uloborus diversus]